MTGRAPVRTVAPCPPPTAPPPSRPGRAGRRPPCRRRDRPRARRGLPGAHRAPRPAGQRLPQRARAGRARRGGGGPAPPRRGRGRSAARRARRGQGQRRHRRRDDVPRDRRRHAPGDGGQRGRAPPARRRRRGRRQDPPPGARGLGPLHRVADLRPDPQSLGPRADDRRVEWRDRRGRGRRHRRRRPGLGRGRLRSRIPAATCGVYGLKPSRGRVPLAPHDDHWHGATVLGPIARDSRAMPRCSSTPSPTRTSFVEATEAEPRRPARRRLLQDTLPRIKLDTRAPRGGGADRALLTASATRWTSATRATGSCRRIMPRTCTARAGRRRPRRARQLEPRTARSRAWAAGWAARAAPGPAPPRGRQRRINAIFDDHDVVLTPVVASPPEAGGHCAGKGPLRTFNGAAPLRRLHRGAGTSTATPPPRCPPAADDAACRWPCSWSAVRGEGHALALSAQLEAVRPWAQRTRSVV